MNELGPLSGEGGERSLDLQMVFNEDRYTQYGLSCMTIQPG